MKSTAIVGLGKVGLPLAIQAAAAGHTVVGIDRSETLVHGLRSGDTSLLEPGIGQALEVALESNHFVATTDLSAVSGVENVLVIVPVGLDHDGKTDLGGIETLTRALARHLTPSVLVSYESTLPVGTTRTLLAPILASESGFTLERDLFVCFSPERVYSGRILADLRAYPKLVGGIGPISTERAVSFYRSFLAFDVRTDLPQPNGVWPMSSADAAEFAKLAETTYRDVNIALANEFALFADSHNLDMGEIIPACNSQPFSHLHRPGISVGGHCIPVYPRFYLDGDPQALLPAAARRINESMPRYAVTTLEGLVGSLQSKTVVVLGVTYRAGVRETTHSGAFRIVDLLQSAGAIALAHDPLLSIGDLEGLGLNSYSLGTPVDAAILHTDHDEYLSLTDSDFPELRAIVDGRGVLAPAMWRHVAFRSIVGGLSF